MPSEGIRLRRGFISAMLSYPLIGGSFFAPQVLLVAFIPYRLIRGGPHPLWATVVLAVLALPAVCWRAEIVDGALRCSTFGVTTLRVDLTRSLGVAIVDTTFPPRLWRVIEIEGAWVDFSLIRGRNGQRNESARSLLMANLLLGGRERNWIEQLGRYTKHGVGMTTNGAGEDRC